MRWGIEKVFPKVAEVFHLQNLIASTPQGTIFPCAFCLLLDNMLEVMRSDLAKSQQVHQETISLENLFCDTHRPLIAWSEMLGPTLTVEYFIPIESPQPLRKHLTAILKPVWSDRWLKAPPKKKSPPPPQKTVAGGHTSTDRVLKKANYHPR